MRSGARTLLVLLVILACGVFVGAAILVTRCKRRSRHPIRDEVGLPSTYEQIQGLRNVAEALRGVEPPVAELDPNTEEEMPDSVQRRDSFTRMQAEMVDALEEFFMSGNLPLGKSDDAGEIPAAELLEDRVQQAKYFYLEGFAAIGIDFRGAAVLVRSMG